MAKMADALDDTLKRDEFKPTGSGLPKPEDIIKYEEAVNRGEVKQPDEAQPLPEEEDGQELSPSGVADIKKDEPATTEELTEVQKLDNLQKKLDAKEELNEDETALFLKIKNEKPVVEEEKTYNIAGQEYTFSELKGKVIEDLELQDAVISEKAMQKVVEDYYKSQNRTEATKSINKGQKENAVERESLRAERAEIIAVQKTIVQTINKLSNDITRLETAASNPVTKEDAEEGDLDVKRAYFSKLDAQEKLKGLREEKESLETQGAKNENSKMKLEVSELQMAQPQYRTKEPLLTVIQKLKNGEQVDPEDELKVQELSDLLETASTRGASLMSIYNLRSKQGMLAVKPLLHKKSVTATLPELNKTSITDAIRRAKERAEKALPNSDGSGGGGQRGGQKTERLATQMINRDKKILGEERDDFAADVLGFGTKKK